MDEPAPRPSRDDIATTSSPASGAGSGPGATPTRPCPVCGTPFVRVRRQLFCSSRCRRTAFRRRTSAAPVVSVPPARSRREHTVYACSECDARYLGEQWCHECARPCMRLGPGGCCPHCDEPILLAELAGDGETSGPAWRA